MMFIINTFIVITVGALALGSVVAMVALPYDMVRMAGHRGWAMVLRGTLVLVSFTTIVFAIIGFPAYLWTPTEAMYGPWVANILWGASVVVSTTVLGRIISKNT